MKNQSDTKSAVYQRLWRQRRKAAGKCANCPNQTTETIRCTECSLKRAAYDKEYIQQRLSAGLCPYCPNQRVDGLTRCNNCVGKHGALYYKRKEKDFAEHGVYQYIAHRRQMREEVIKHYGTVCVICQEHRLPFLTIDHIENNGSEHKRQTNGESGKQLALWLKKHNFPSGYQIMCWNHNILKWRNIISQNLSMSPNTIVKRRYNTNLKRRVIEAYGGKCVCCGINNHDVLTLDHVENDGADDREKYNRTTFFRMILRNHQPSKYQILCFNCNCGRACNSGICPHKEINQSLQLSHQDQIVLS